jgi:D-methionine transport system ATP-binding protein
MITAKNIYKSFGDVTVLGGLDLNIRRGSIYGLAGRSGAGKSTLLRCINGLEKYESGSMIVDGTDVKSLSNKEIMAFRKNIGMIFQHFSLLERLTVYENVALPLRCWKYKSAFIGKRVKELLEIVGIPEKIYQKPRELSGGQKQRVAIARALSMEPHILLCDEATSALDPKTSKTIIALLKQINRQMGITIVFVTHQMSVIRGLCEEMGVIENGKTAVNGKVEEIFREQPAALKNLIGEESAIITDNAEKTIALTLPDVSANSFVAEMAITLGIDITIQGGASGYFGNNPSGLLVRIPENVYHDTERYLMKHNVVWKNINVSDNNTKAVENEAKKNQKPSSMLQQEIL